MEVAFQNAISLTNFSCHELKLSTAFAAKVRVFTNLFLIPAFWMLTNFRSGGVPIAQRKHGKVTI